MNLVIHKIKPVNTKAITLNIAGKIDPTRTLTLRNRFAAECTRRFKSVRKLISVSIIDNDCFGLTEKKQFTLAAISPRQFEFKTTDEKIKGFMKWLKEQEELYIFSSGAQGASPISIPGDFRTGNWTDQYILSAYQQGIIRARQELRKIGVDIPFTIDEDIIGSVNAAMNHPIHSETVAALYTRVFNELRGIDEAMDQQISRVLAEGLVNGLSQGEIARLINDRVDKIGITRAKVLARTEIIRAHHIANINEYEMAGIKGVIVQAEWLPAGFNVCPVCMDFASKDNGDGPGVYTLEKIKGMIPAHPNCRCIALPWRADWN